jgi:tRNA pseudouridine55 synthase
MDGILVLLKPPGPTSHDMVALVRRLATTRRVGHGGTLDPFASGVLPLFLGRATRMLEYHLGDAKSYRATVCFGSSSTTDDLEGELTPSDGPSPDRDRVEEALGSFRGTILQVPPAFSAVHVGGRRAYALARAGETPVLAPREVTIAGLDLVDWDGTDPERPIAVVDVRCTAGTYVRALARDLGGQLGTAAYLGALVRTATGPFRIEDALPLEAVRAAAAEGPDGIASLLVRPDTGLEGIPAIVLGPPDVEAIARGQFVRLPAGSAIDGSAGSVRLLDADGRLVAMAHVASGRLAPEKVFVDAPAAALSEAEDAAELEASILAERDPDEGVDPDPASPDDV